MKGYVANIEQQSLENSFFRKVLYTDKRLQLVLMSLLPQEDIGMEVHEEVDQFLRVEQGTGKAIINGSEHVLTDGSVVIVPAGMEHNIMNTGEITMKLYTLYMPPHHRHGVIHQTKEEALADDEHFDGSISE